MGAYCNVRPMKGVRSPAQRSWAKQRSAGWHGVLEHRQGEDDIHVEEVMCQGVSEPEWGVGGGGNGRSFIYRQTGQIIYRGQWWSGFHYNRRITKMEREKTRMNCVVLDWHWKYQYKLMIICVRVYTWFYICIHIHTTYLHRCVKVGVYTDITE